MARNHIIPEYEETITYKNKVFMEELNAGKLSCCICKSKNIYDIRVRDGMIYRIYYNKDQKPFCVKCFRHAEKIDRILSLFVWIILRIYVKIARKIDS